MKKKIGDVEYEIMPIPPHLSPFNTIISELLQRKPANLNEAKENSEQIRECMKQVFSETVKPQPKLEHHTQIYNALMALTNAVIEEAQLFRKPQRSSSAKGSPTRVDSASETNGDTTTKRT